jgi:predicted transcriptional regulator
MKERRYYPATMGFNKMEDRSASDEVRSIIANPTGARIVEILRSGEATQSEIVDNVGVSPSTVHWHMGRMEKVGIISKRREGRTVRYRLTMSTPKV